MITVTKKPPVIALCDNPMYFEFTTDLEAGTDGVFFLIEPWYTSGGLVTGTEALYPPVPGAADVDLSEYLRRDMFAIKQFVFPEQGNIPWNAKAGLIKEYKIKIQECWFDEDGDPVVVTSWLENRYVVRGKIPRWKKAAFYARWSSYLEWISTEKAFLTFAPKTLITKVDQMQKLFLPIWWETTSGERLKLKVDVLFTDGTNANFTTTQETGDLSRYTIIEFGVSYSLLNLSSWATTNHPGKTIAKYDVTALSGETAVSETRTYIMDYTKSLGKREFLFANSAGGYDTMVATGISELNAEYKYENANQQSPGVQNLPEKTQTFVDDSNTHTCRTGYINAAMAEYLAEFFISPERYEVEGSALIPIVLKDSKIMHKRDSENLFYAEFDYEYALNQKVEVG